MSYNVFQVIDTGQFATTGNLNLVSGNLQTQINAITLSGGGISTGNADLRYYPKSSNPSGYVPLTSGNTLYYGGNNPSGYTTSAAVTGYVTGLSGQFYPRSGNPSGFISSLQYASNVNSGMIYLGAYNCLSVYTGNVVSRSGVSSNDGATPRTGLDSVLLAAQTTGAQNGPWVVNSGNWTRPNWYSSGNTAQSFYGANIFITSGTSGGGTTWKINTTGNITIDATSITFSKVPNVLASQSLQGEVQLSTFQETRDSTSASKVASLSILRSMLLSDLRIIDLFGSTQTLTGSSTVTIAATSQAVDSTTGATAGSTWDRVTTIYPSVGSFGAISQAAGKPFSYGVSLTATSASTNGIFRVLIGNNGGSAAPTAHAVGIEFRNLRLWLIAHDGSILTNIDTGFDVISSSQTLYRFMISSDGLGGMSVYCSNNSVTYISSGAPTAGFTATFHIGGTNGIDTSANRWQVFKNLTFFGQ